MKLLYEEIIAKLNENKEIAPILTQIVEQVTESKDRAAAVAAEEEQKREASKSPRPRGSDKIRRPKSSNLTGKSTQLKKSA